MADQYRVLYTKISQLRRGQPHTILSISSPVKGEGKTVTAFNLAIVMARDFGKKTLLIEGDLKSPMLSRYLQTKLNEGLVDVLLERRDLRSTLVNLGHDNLSVLPAGKSLPNSSTLLSSARMRGLIGTLREQYDIILIDSPPILPLPDMNIFEELVDSIILVVRAESTPRDALVRAIHSLATRKLLGIVLNDMRRPPARYYRYDYKSA
jgi:capsular exopolysaccharide synthesis family protein